MKITIYGASDDLIEIDGDYAEEFNPASEPAFLVFSTGTVLKVLYDDEGMWRINILKPGECVIEKKEATDIESDYSDKVEIEGRLEWVLFATEAKFERIKSKD